MRAMEENDFLVEIGAHCFLCLNRIPTPVISHLSTTKEPGSGLPIPTQLSTPPTYSLQHFTRYLKMDMTRVFNTNEQISTDLLAKVERAKLKVELCEECAFQTERFSTLCKQLEKIEIEIGFHMKLIQGKLTKAETNQLGHSRESSKFLGKLEIANALREEAAKKCSVKLDGRITPRVKVQRQTKRQLDAKTFKIKSIKRTNSFSTSEHYPSISENPISSPYQRFDVDAKMAKAGDSPLPLNSFTNEADDDDMGYPEDSNRDLDNASPSLSTAPNLDTKPRIVPPTPQSRVDPKTGKHKCNICSKEFSRADHYKRHYRSVHLKIRYRCSICSKDFTDPDNYRQHLKREHLGIRFKCQACARTFKRRSNLQVHIQKSNCVKGS